MKSRHAAQHTTAAKVPGDARGNIPWQPRDWAMLKLGCPDELEEHACPLLLCRHCICKIILLNPLEDSHAVGKGSLHEDAMSELVVRPTGMLLHDGFPDVIAASAVANLKMHHQHPPEHAVHCLQG